jgi:thioredoxin-like negative regulator of GroEL
LLEQVPAGFEADGLRARIELQRAGELDDALAAIDAADPERAFDLLLAALDETGGQREDVRRVIVGELARLEAGDPLARETRRRLAAVLF